MTSTSPIIPRCAFPYAHEPACDETIAQTGGGSYTAFFTGWLVAASIFFVIHVIQFIRMCRIRGWTRKLFFTSYLHQVYSISLYNVFTILIRSVDPLNYADRLPFAFYRLLADTSAWTAYALVMLCICSWVKILRQISGRSPRPVVFGERITLCISLCFFVGASFARSYSSREYLAEAIIEIVCAAYALTLCCFAWGNGLPVYCHLSRFERGQADAAAKLKPTPGNSPIPSSSTKLTKPNRSLTKKKLKIIVILKLMSIMTVVLLITVGFDVYWILLAFQDKYHHITNPYPYPTWTFGATLTDCASMIITSIGSISCLYFFRRFGNETNVESNSINAKSGSSDPTKPTDRFHARMNSGFMSTNTMTGQPQHRRMDSGGFALNTNEALLRMNTGLHHKGASSMEMPERLSGIIVTDTPAPLLNHHIQASDDTQHQFSAFQTPPSAVRTHVPPNPYSRTTSPDQSGANTARDHINEAAMPPRHPCQPPSPHGSAHVDQVVVVVDTTHTPAESRNTSQESQNSHSSRKQAAINHI